MKNHSATKKGPGRKHEQFKELNGQKLLFQNPPGSKLARRVFKQTIGKAIIK